MFSSPWRDTQSAYGQAADCFFLNKVLALHALNFSEIWSVLTFRNYYWIPFGVTSVGKNRFRNEDLVDTMWSPPKICCVNSTKKPIPNFCSLKINVSFKDHEFVVLLLLIYSEGMGIAQYQKFIL